MPNAIFRLSCAALTLSLPLFAAPPLEAVQVTTTERVDLAAGGTVHFIHSTGELNVEAWDQPTVEVTLTRTTFRHPDSKEQELAKQALGRIQLSAKASGNGVDVNTDIPTRPRLVRMLPGSRGVYLNYQVRVPRDAKLVIDHQTGAVNLLGVAGDLEAHVHTGDIVAQLPGSVPYAFDAHCKIGGVYSDFEGKNGAHFTGQSFTTPGGASAHHASLTVGVGGISIQRL